MKIQAAYDRWSTTYDSDENLTRDLDQWATKQTLVNFQCNSILELGCGTGKNTVFFSQIGTRVLALDFSAGMIARAKQKLNANHVTFLKADLTQPWPCGDRAFDLIACNLVLEHIENLAFIFSEAFRILVEGGHFFICELHPFRQYLGGRATFKSDSETVEIGAFIHNLSDFIRLAAAQGFRLEEFKEWWHEADQDKPPRLVSFLFRKPD